MKRSIILFIWLLLLFQTTLCFSDQTIIVKKTAEPPLIDGSANEAVWQATDFFVTHDDVGDIDVRMKALYTEGAIFMLVEFPDADESRSHKSLLWNTTFEMYEPDVDREDCFVFKWNMNKDTVDLRLTSSDSYKADIWFWKACRTDPMGFADDKFHVVTPKMDRNTVLLPTNTDEKRYLSRLGDAGTSAYKNRVVADFEGHRIDRFEYHDPEGSRADVKAKGLWNNGVWTVEFSRALQTNHDDDVQFDVTEQYEFGISRYEISGRGSEEKASQPLYGAGDVSETLVLQFEQ